MASRMELQRKLASIPEIQKVYFQPPEGLKLEYDCIVYKLNDIVPRNADNIPYSLNYQYTITLICRDPDNEAKDILASWPKCRANGFFVSDNLYHYKYTLYF